MCTSAPSISHSTIAYSFTQQVFCVQNRFRRQQQPARKRVAQPRARCSQQPAALSIFQIATLTQFSARETESIHMHTQILSRREREKDSLGSIAPSSSVRAAPTISHLDCAPTFGITPPPPLTYLGCIRARRRRSLADVMRCTVQVGAKRKVFIYKIYLDEICSRRDSAIAIKMTCKEERCWSCFCSDLLGFNLITSCPFLRTSVPRCINAHSHCDVLSEVC